MSVLNLLQKTISKNGNLLKQIRPLHITSTRNTKSVAPRESLNSEYVLYHNIDSQM